MARLLHLYRRYYPDEGGIEWTMRKFCEYAAGLGHDVSALVSARYPWSVRAQINEVEVVRAGCVGTVANTPICPTMPAWLRRLKPDLVELHHAYPYGMWALLQSGYRGRLIVHYHFDISRFGRLQRFVTPVLQEVLRRADRIFVNSESYARTSPVLQHWLGKCVYIAPGVEPCKFELSDQQQQRVGALRAQGRFRVLFVGRLSHYKGLADLLTAMQWVEGELVVIGRGGMESRMRGLAELLGIASRVHFLGRVADDELACQYHSAEAVVLPSVSRGESFGVAQVEAMLCARPVVCSNLPGVCEVGVEGETTLLFEPGDPRGLAEALNRLAADAKLRENMGRAGRSRALVEYDLQQVNLRRWAVYRELLGA